MSDAKMPELLRAWPCVSQYQKVTLAGGRPVDETTYIRSDLCASGQQVRALEWKYSATDYFDRETGTDRTAAEFWQEKTFLMIGTYTIMRLVDPRVRGDREIYRLTLAGEYIKFPTLEAAKAAAQADYERRIRAALTPAPDHRSFPDAADGRPLPTMADELMTAGLSGEDARFVAIQLAQNGLMLVPAPQDWGTGGGSRFIEKRKAHEAAPAPGIAEAAAVLLTDLNAIDTLVKFQLRHTVGVSDKTRSMRYKQVVAALRALKGDTDV